MVEETIRSIRETEEQADKLIKQAEEKKQESWKRQKRRHRACRKKSSGKPGPMLLQWLSRQMKKRGAKKRVSMSRRLRRVAKLKAEALEKEKEAAAAVVSVIV